MKKIYFFVLFTFVCLFSYSQIVISQVYGGGGNSGAPFTNDFVELFNQSGTPVDISDYTLRYASTSGNFGGNNLILPQGSIIAANSYFLVQLAGGSAGVPLPTPDATGSFNMAGANGKIALFNDSDTTFGGSNPIGEPNLVDFVGYGTANAFEGSSAAPAASNTTSLFRGNNGCIDTNNNGDDFTVGAPQPRNSQSASFTCGGINLTVTSPSNNTIFNPLVTDVSIGINVTNFIIGDNPSDDGFIKYSLNEGGILNKFDANPINLTNLSTGAYTVNLELVDAGGNSLSPAIVASVNFSIASLNSVVNIAAVKADLAAEGAGLYYELNSEAIVTYTRTNRNQKYIQDGTGGLLVDDPNGIITSTLNENDGILNFKFETVLFNGLLQARPIENISANSTGNPVTPIVLSISDYVTNFVQHESTVIQFNNVTISEGNGIAVFAVNTNYTVTDGTDNVAFRTIFTEADYIGQIIPSAADNRIFIAGRFNTTPQVVAKNLQDLSLSTEQFNITNFSIYPNPVTKGIVTINSTNADAMQVQVYDVLGKVVKNETVNNNTLDVSNLNTGLYIVKITQNQSSVTKKLVIK